MKKFQASMEFLVVYGFAIMVVIGIVAVFFYLNVNPEQKIPNDCRFNVEIECVDYIVSLFGDSSFPIPSGTSLVFVNKGQTMHDVRLKCLYEDNSVKEGTAVGLVRSGEQAIISCPLPDAAIRSGEKIRIDAEIIYHLNLTSYRNWRNYDGMIITTVRETN